MDLTIPVSIAVFFLGLIATIRYGLPRWKDVQTLQAAVDALNEADIHTRLETVETNVKTLNGNLVSLRDAQQFKGVIKR